MAKLYFYYASMNAGKSTNLLQADFNYRERGMQTLLFTAGIDTRYKQGVIKSRIGLEAPAIAFFEESSLWDIIQEQHVKNPLHCILIDEAQFLNKNQVFELARVCDDLNIPVLCYGLRTDFQAELFEGSKYLLAIADKLAEIKSVCFCGAKATMNLRVDENKKPIRHGQQTDIGGNERYIALCRRHFIEKLNSL
ncbi:thymidine kinase [Zymomonas mobilis]|uniref:Thymidine kinase n=1 Tax=Zymomonas mobilis subsp. mobilis (strain ATCC 10988 / DSM 424 / LMG 404 / NCIMB 8938 / NRRL B-806 / ZM1) TaxID=555217 RepID=A0A0H3G282_ZYMMA|nr:thymidine kinase [Zymomonas mobilis]AEH62913.1 Thymidine kinase [Zymomonas mobilis subsp. mobilis ATCC 10988]ART93194.1 thymidine kinase [Zymomonas mobilis subsp. mobilis]TQL27479.1 thymidine kinase [Zymomonas mobilis]TQL29422.1 thymidine kinase [Zymomonas mobilis]TWD59874.1 thymidine kinase [Zymomonas mobilis]